MIVSRLKKFCLEEHDFLGLYGGVVLYAFALGVWILSLPFIVKRLSGSDTEVGLCMGLGAGGYIAAMLLSRAFGLSVNPKRLVQCGAGSFVLTAAAAIATVYAANNGLSHNFAVTILIAICTVQGFMMSTFWPQIMTWISTGHDGPELNRKLGVFNISWSVAGIISPGVAGFLVEINSILPLMTCTAACVLCFVAISVAKKPQIASDTAIDNAQNDIEGPSELLRKKMLWMARIAFFTGFVCVSLLLAQLPLLFKFNLGFSESDYGFAVMIIFMVSFFVFFITGKTHAWHYRMRIFFAVQLLLILSMCMILNATGLWLFFVAAVLIGVGRAFVYISHLYYGVSGAGNRIAKMTMHEIILNIAVIVGSVVGGLLGEHFNRYTPYWFCIAVIAGGLVVQIVLWRLLDERV